MPVTSNALKSKCRLQSANSDYEMLLLKKIVMHVEYPEYKYKNFAVFSHIEHKTTKYVYVFALVRFTRIENVAIYLFETCI